MGWGWFHYGHYWVHVLGQLKDSVLAETLNVAYLIFNPLTCCREAFTSSPATHTNTASGVTSQQVSIRRK
jgi:hypothetical protein